VTTSVPGHISPIFLCSTIHFVERGTFGLSLPFGFSNFAGFDFAASSISSGFVFGPSSSRARIQAPATSPVVGALSVGSSFFAVELSLVTLAEASCHRGKGTTHGGRGSPVDTWDPNWTYWTEPGPDEVLGNGMAIRKPTPRFELGTPSLRVKCSTS
jgi:hypothetical protein